MPSRIYINYKMVHYQTKVGHKSVHLLYIFEAMLQLLFLVIYYLTKNWLLFLIVISFIVINFLNCKI